MENPSSDAEAPKRKPGGRKPSDKSGGNTSDPYHSGHFTFVDQEGMNLALQYGKKTPDEVMEAAEEGAISLEECGKMMICWNPGKKGHTEELEQGQFSVRDNLLTRQQLATTPILTRRAALCIVDFCPDLLWREMLLRIISEAGYGNKEVRDRMCYNGNYCDKATITKRIGAALGQKQVQSNTKRRKKEAGEGEGEADVEGSEKPKGYSQEEEDYFQHNLANHKKYMAYFGQRNSHRGQFGFAAKRKVAVDENEDGSGESGAEEESNHVGKDEDAEMEGMGDIEEETEDEGTNSDAVSVQSDTILDEMED